MTGGETRTFGPVRLEREAGVARVVLDDPERRNPLSVEMATGIVDAVEALEGSDVRCVVVEGAGPAFCAGGDVDLMRERAEGGQSADEAVRHVVRNTGRCVRRIAECEFPTVAKVDGAAFGAGANLAIACDLQLLHEGAQMGFGFRRVGLAVDSGTTWLLPRLVGENVAKELVYTGELLDAERAADLGLANRVYPADEFDERATAFVERVASGPTVALRTSKRLFRLNANATLGAAIENEAGAQAAALGSADHAEGVEAFFDRREPEFEGR